MKKISVFNHVSVDGFFAGPNEEIDWFQAAHDDEWNRFSQEHANFSHNTLMFGRTTYDMMKSWWPTPAGMQMDPHMAHIMNYSPKIVFSTSLKSVEDEPNWKNTRVLHHMDQDEVRNLDEEITILGSGSIVQQLTDLRLIYEYTLVVIPIVLGMGKLLFNDVHRINLNLVEHRAFRNGIVLLRYQPR